MAFSHKRLVVVHFSPAGSTACVARIIQSEIAALGIDAALINLTKHDDISGIVSEMKTDDRELGLFIGSPVYANRAVPPVLDFILQLPPEIAGFGVPFVTWGGVCSGGALDELGSALIGKGLRLTGALKVPAVHSLIWDSDLDPGAGRPNSDDERMIKEFVGRVVEKASCRDSRDIEPSAMNYLAVDGKDPLKNMSYNDVKRNYPGREIQLDKCTQCGVCEDDCPVNAITMSPFPEFGDACVFCYNCVRYCPESAIKTDLSMLQDRILMRSKEIAEPLETRMWV